MTRRARSKVDLPAALCPSALCPSALCPSALSLSALCLRALCLSALVAAASCVVDVPLSGKGCGDGHDCVPGYVCRANVCVERLSAPPLDAGSLPGDAGATLDGGGEEDAGGSIDAGSPDAGTPDAGPADAGEPDAGDAGDAPEDAGADAGELADAGGHDAGAVGDVDAGAEPDAGHDAGPTELPLFGSGRDGPLSVTSTLAPNICRSLLSSDATSVSLSTASGIEAGMLVLLWQVQDSFAAVADQSSLSAPGEAGVFEIVRVSARMGGRVFTEPPPSHSFRSEDGAVAQACSVPEHTTVEVSDTGVLRAAPWNGAVGGIVALFASERVTIAAGGRVDASGRGFRGGLTDPGTNDADGITLEITDREQGGQKGEGLDPAAVGLYGRGNFANGGGGGNAHNAGGGGGGNGGRGGQGGIEWVDSAVVETAGRGGVNVANLDRLVLGGGGGAGEFHHDSGADGGNGGGIVLILTPALAGGGELRANGASAISVVEAGSGGGAGGGVLVLAPDVSAFSGSASARGGNGGDADVGLGPGGGGGGGVVLGLAESASVDVTGGSNGTADGDARGAEPGEDGLVFAP